MDTEKLNEQLIAIAEQKNTLAKLDYNDVKYDDVEEELHDLEDDLVEEYGEYLEDALNNIHDKLKADSDVLLPTAYLANEYISSKKGEYKVTSSEGVLIDTEEYEGKETRLVLMPNPTRIMLQVNGVQQQVWSADQ